MNVHWRWPALSASGKSEEAKAEFDKAKKLNKKADDDLYKKIANGQKGPRRPTIPRPAGKHDSSQLNRRL